jgi:hypothetical protein
VKGWVRRGHYESEMSKLDRQAMTLIFANRKGLNMQK